MLKAIIFDMDGTLVNSPKYVTIAFNKLLEKYGVHLSKKYRKKTLGKSSKDQIAVWRKDFNIKEKIDYLDFSKKAFVIELKLMKKELKPNKHILKLIQTAKQEGIKIAVATSSTSARAKKILELIGILDKLDSISTAEDVEKNKPDPSFFLKTAKELKINPKDCVVIEDAVNGIQAAKNAGMKSVALLTEFHSRKEFIKIADLIINNLSELTLNKLKEL